MADVFLSYNREDRERAQLVADALQAEGCSVWWDAALRAGETYDEVTEKNLREAGAVVVLWSKRSVNSKWVRAEATIGERSSTLVPALLEECDRPVRFELVQTADLTRWRGERSDPNWRDFVQDVRQAIDNARTKSAQPKPAQPHPEAADGASIEMTFWNSIKGGARKADYEAYLARYPQGHFADLARSRIATMDRTLAQQQQQRQATAPPPPAPAKKSGLGLILTGAVYAVVMFGFVAVILMHGANKTPSPVEIAGVSVDASPAESEIESEGASGAALSSIVAVDEEGGEPDTQEPIIDVYADAAETDASGEAPQPTVETLNASAGSATQAGASKSSSARTAAANVPAPASPGETFRDCDACPLMVAIPAGTFQMGSPRDEAGRNAYEGPQHEVAVKRFAIGAYEVTAGEWKACVADGSCAAKRSDDDRLPILSVSWREAVAYSRWLSKKTGKTYRLPSEAEWEYAARAGAMTAYWWGDRFERARVASGGAKPVGSFEPNAFGLYDVHGNASEWVEDCYINNYTATPTDGSAMKGGDCSLRVIRGGSWQNAASDLRVANRSRIGVDVGARYMGFRVAAVID